MPHWTSENMLPEPEEFAKLFHELFKHQLMWKKHVQWKRLKKKNAKLSDRLKNKLESLYADYGCLSPPDVDLPGNASTFAVFASVRLAVLERWMRWACHEYHLSSSSSPPGDVSGADSDTDDLTQSSINTPVPVPKIVNVGLRSVFELIRESRTTHPTLCTKALSALLDVLQGQTPEGLKAEPPEAIEPLFDLLLDLAVLHGPESSVPNDGRHLTAVACACLLALVVVRGDTGKFVSAMAALLMCPRALSTQNIQMPAVLTALQRCIHNVLLSKIVRPDWITHGVPANSRIDAFRIRLPPDVQAVRSVCSDGQYLYLLTSRGLFKVGSGYGGTVKGHIYMHRTDFYPNERGWLGFCNNKLYLRRGLKQGTELLIVERDGLLVTGALSLETRDSSACVMFSDGENLGVISVAKDDGFIVRTLSPLSSPPTVINELSLKLARRCVDVLGAATHERVASGNAVIMNSNEPPASHCLPPEELHAIVAGKEFTLVRTAVGHVMYCGKSAALGLKQTGGGHPGKWSELSLTKSPKVVHIAVGHEGMHAILVTEDGSAFFAGLARRGEDGDQNKARRQPKPSKPKKMIKVDDKFIVHAACNSATTALVTRDGELLMFGKDTAYADPSTGVVSDLKGEHITQVALGKAHAVALTVKGHVFTFGINNKYQCGREFPHHSREAPNNAPDLGSPIEQTSQNVMTESRMMDGNLCSKYNHEWRVDRCMICKICGECTEFGSSCYNAFLPDRYPGQECGCGAGQSGCAVCGCCKACGGGYNSNADEPQPDKSRYTGNNAYGYYSDASKEEQKKKQRKSGICTSKHLGKPSSASRAGIVKSITKQVTQSNISNAIANMNNILDATAKESGADGDKDTTRVGSLGPGRLHLPSESPVTQVACGLHHTVLLLQNGMVYTFGSNQYGQLGSGDIVALTTGPQLVRVSASHVAAGSNHTVILTSRGEVHTFGNHQNGQLGRNAPTADPDTASVVDDLIEVRYPWHASPGPVPHVGQRYGRRATWVGASGDQTFLKIDESLVNSVSLSRSTVIANKNSIVLLPNQTERHNSVKCLVINRHDGGCSSYSGKEQVNFADMSTCMDPLYNVIWSYNLINQEMSCYNVVACQIPTLVRVNESRFLSNIQNTYVMPEKLSDKQNVPSARNISDNEKNDEKLIKSVSSKSISIDKKIIASRGIHFSNTANAAYVRVPPTPESPSDPHGGLLKNVLNSDQFNLGAILSSELALPIVANCQVTRSQAALHLLCCLDTLTVAYDLKMTVNLEMDEKDASPSKSYTKDDFQAVNRFENYGGGWGYSGHSCEAIRFMADTDVLIGGFGLFGGRGEYTTRIRLLDLGVEGGEHEGEGELLAETDMQHYECPIRQKHPILFDVPVPIKANRWCLAWCRVSGPSSDCGSAGQSMVNSEDQVVFYFKSSKKSNNGTDVNAGQIPQILYRIITPENQSTTRPPETQEPVHVLSKDFSRSVSKECFQSLLALLQWSWNTFKVALVEVQSPQTYSSLELERLVYISRASLRLIRTYTNEIYPNHVSKKTPMENVVLAQSIGDVRALLKQILSDSVRKRKGKSHKLSESHLNMVNGIFDECHQTFVACFHAFYPTAFLKWNCLCDLLFEMDKDKDSVSHHKNERLLSAVVAALCGATVRLRSLCPTLYNTKHQSPGHSSSEGGLSPSDNSGLPIMSPGDGHCYPILVEQMSYRTQIEGGGNDINWSLREVVDRLLAMVTEPVRARLMGANHHRHLPSLTRHACHLLAKLLAELAYQCSTADEELQGGCGRGPLHSTPLRFARTNQSRPWNTGGGSPDAICIRVDRSGVAIAGVAIYAGQGQYDYELELIEDTTSGDPSHTHSQRWVTLEQIKGTFGPDDCVSDIVDIKFENPVPIKDNVSYAIRLRNHGGRTNNGDGGFSSVKGPDGTTFTFSTCSLSFNGTTQTRGQFPYILYYSNPLDLSQHSSRMAMEQEARQCTLTMVATIVQKCSDLLVIGRENSSAGISYPPGAAPWEIIGEACAFNMLLPNIFAHVSSIVSSDPRSAVRLLGLIQDMLPHVAALNLLAGGETGSLTQSGGTPDLSLITTSQHYAYVESEHPYKPATVSQSKVLFPASVKWISLEFDPACAMAQPEDSLQIFVPKLGHNVPVSSTVNQNTSSPEEGPPVAPHWPVLQKFTSSSQWPQTAVVLPGNEVLFSLETASDYNEHNDKNCTYGYRCLAVGYEWPPFIGAPGLIHLEAELAFLGGMCAASLMKKDLQLPIVSDDDLEKDGEMCEVVAQNVVREHAFLLSKGLALANPPTAMQALEGTLPYSAKSNEKLFLRDFVRCAAGTSGGRLAHWLQPDSHVDVVRCQVLYSRDDLRAGWPAIVTVVTRDQYSDVVNVTGLQVSVKAVFMDKLEADCDASRKMRRLSQPETYNNDSPNHQHSNNDPDSASLSSVKANQNIENLYCPPPVSYRTVERMRVRNNGDGTYSASWTPAAIGCYSLVVDIDGYQMEEAFKVEVKEPPQGLTPPTQTHIKRPAQQPNKLRKFVAKNSAGLRIRAHPSLQSEQIGIVYVNGTIAFIEEIHNDDGVWLRLSAETIKQYCPNPVMEAWCLQYNQHLGKTLLLPVEEPKSILEQLIKETIQKRMPDVTKDSKSKQAMLPPGVYTVIKCGASGHNVRSHPSLTAPPVGMLVLGNQVNIKQCIVNTEGVWLLLDHNTIDKYCFNTDEEAWTLAMNRHDVMYLKGEGDHNEKGKSRPTSSDHPSPNKRGFNFSIASTSKVKTPETTCYAFNSRNERTPPVPIESKPTNPFVFGENADANEYRTESAKIPRIDKPKVIQKFLKAEEPRALYSSDKEIPAELSGVSVKDLVKAIGESRANGNGITPPDTPRRCASPRGGISPRINSRSSSPVPIPVGGSLCRAGAPVAAPMLGPVVPGAQGGRSVFHDSASSSPQACGSSRSIGISPLVSGTAGGPDSGVTSQRRSSTQSDTSALVSSLTRDLSQSPSQATANTRDPSPTPSGSSSLHSPPDTPSTPNKREDHSENSPRKVTQAGTQTSPENSSGTTAIRSHFSIGTSHKEPAKLSPKLCRKGRNAKRAISPAKLQQLPQVNKNVTFPPKEPVKQAISPSVAESNRAVFAAFLWHEGIVHDAMACASFLKFHPSLPKKGALVVTRHTSSASSHQPSSRQRHSVEVTNAGNYLHIQPSTLETLTRSAANANANRNRTKKAQADTVIKEETVSDVKIADTNYHTVTVLPPALKALVYLWEELASNALQSAMLEELLACPMNKLDKKDEKAVNMCRNNAKDKNLAVAERESKKLNKKILEYRPNYREETLIVEEGGAVVDGGVERQTVCELCGGSYAHPVTYHMRQQHPGCGAHARGKGYNSGGNFCVGWAGTCGDGGIGGSTWYLICDACRNRYMKAKKNKPEKIGASNKAKGSVKKKAMETSGGSIPGSPAIVNISPAHAINSPDDNPVIEAHRVMMNNAMFLLELASAAGLTPNTRRSSLGNMPSVSENYSPPECGGPFSPVPPFQCLPALGVTPAYDEPIFSESQLRVHNVQDRNNGRPPGPSLSGPRPLSEVSLSDNECDYGKSLRFHRSVSMGTNGAPWSRTGQDGRVIMMRKRNNSSSELSNESGSSLLCHPSTTLQRLVPMIDNTAIVSSTPQNIEHDGENVEPLMLLRRPVIGFILQRHDLQGLQFALKQALRKAACRVYAMQALNWLLKSVTQPICLHDLLWWFVTALTPVELENDCDEDNKEHKDNRKTDDYELLNVCEHPLSDISIAGEAAWPLPSAFHSLLQTISDVMLALPLGSPLQQAAVRCWGLRFTHSDHSFLHRSHVFSNISKILSRSEEMEDSTVSICDSHHSVYTQLGTSVVESLQDLTPYLEVKASSRPAMTNCLTDSSTETFWESGDEDRNKTKWLNISCAAHHQPCLIFVYVDNCRDPANKITNITFYSGPNTDDYVKLKSIELEIRLVGCWNYCYISDETHTALRLELKGPDNTLRVRQLRVLGNAPFDTLNRAQRSRSHTKMPAPTAILQQRACEAETLRVFRLITSQVFGKLILGEVSPSGSSASRLADSGASLSTNDSLEPPEESTELREHMLGILFSRSKLTHLQKQVIVHIVQAIRKEAYRVRDEWETFLSSNISPTTCAPPSFSPTASKPAATTPLADKNSVTMPNGATSSSTESPKASDTYCFEMLSMVLALSGSSVGRSYLSHQYGLLRDILCLLHTGSARVQRQVTSLLRRMLPEISPATLANVLDIERLPPADFSIITATSKSSSDDEHFDVHRIGILDVFLACIAKALNVQVKVKGTEANNGASNKGLSTVTLSSCVDPIFQPDIRWYLRGTTTRKLAEEIVQLIKDMAAGKLSDAWAHVTKGAIAENILQLTRLSDAQRVPSTCLQTPTLWLALASLCALDPEHGKRLSSARWGHQNDGQPAPPRPTCSNHDDGMTYAIIQCNVCGNLCADCDRFLHLHRRTRMHQRQVCKEEEEAIKVELHEGCGRTKLFWLLALADASTLKALVEFRTGGTRINIAGSGTGVCRFCGATSNTGLLAIGNVCADHECQEYGKMACSKVHTCGHVCGGVRNEATCLPCLQGCAATSDLRQDADDMCMICFTEALSCAPAIQLKCGHVFHLHCCRAVLMKRWAGPRITFAFSQCPICKSSIEHDALSEELRSVQDLYADVRRKALMRLEYEGGRGGELPPHSDPATYAMERYAYYVCYKCKKAYYGGEARCDAELGTEYDPTELVCGGCSDVARAQMCPRHGTDFLEYKCRYCCSVAVFFCFGSTHFCNPCHEDFQKITGVSKLELPACPAGPKMKKIEGDECPLHVKHPPTGEEYALGCGVCRNAHTF